MAVVLVTTINGIVKHQKQQQMQHWKHESRTSKANSTLKFTFTNVTRVQACKRRSIGDRGIPLHFQRHRDERATDAHGTSCICSLSRQHPGCHSCCACIRSQRCVSKSRIRPKTIRSQLRCDRREVQLPKGRQSKEVAEGLSCQYRPRRRCIHCAKGLLLLQVLGLLKVVLLLQETGETRPRRQQMHVKRLLP